MAYVFGWRGSTVPAETHRTSPGSNGPEMRANVLVCFHIREEHLRNLHETGDLKLPGAVDNELPEPVASSFQDSFESLSLFS